MEIQLSGRTLAQLVEALGLILSSGEKNLIKNKEGDQELNYTASVKKKKKGLDKCLKSYNKAETRIFSTHAFVTLGSSLAYYVLWIIYKQ